MSTATRDPASAAIEALVAYLTTHLSTLTVLRGWPEDSVDLDLGAHPTLSVEEIPGGTTEETASPAILGSVTAGAIELFQGPIRVAVQMDLWAAYREALDAAALLVEAALQNNLPWRPYLYLTATDYHATPITVIRTASAPDVAGDSAQAGQWRRTWTLRIEMDRRTTVTMAAATVTTTLADL